MEKKCIYKSNCGICELQSTANIIQPCLEGPCPHETYACWIRSEEGTYCSECGRMALMTVFDEEKLSNYCPYCGMPMKETRTEEEEYGQ